MLVKFKRNLYIKALVLSFKIIDILEGGKISATIRYFLSEISCLQVIYRAVFKLFAYLFKY